MVYAMRDMIKRYENFIKYSLIGVTGVALDFSMFAILTKYFNVYYQYANILSVSLGITNNFLLNAYFNFKLTDNLFVRFMKFYSVGLVGLMLSSVCLFVFIEVMLIEGIVAKIVVIGVVAIVQFKLNKIFTFKEYPQVESADINRSHVQERGSK